MLLSFGIAFIGHVISKIWSGESFSARRHHISLGVPYGPDRGAACSELNERSLGLALRHELAHSMRVSEQRRLWAAGGRVASDRVSGGRLAHGIGHLEGRFHTFRPSLARADRVRDGSSVQR